MNKKSERGTKRKRRNADGNKAAEVFSLEFSRMICENKRKNLVTNDVENEVELLRVGKFRGFTNYLKF